MAKQDDGLFLLEVLIDKIVFVKSPCFSDKDFRTCVNIECPDVEPLEICDDDSGACIAKSGGPFVKTFNNGKSCLFSLKEADINKAMTTFPIKISVYKSLPCGCLPTKINMGEATIDMTKEFVQARKMFLEDPTNVSYQALKDSFRIVGPDGSETGEIVMFLRISCFGKLIITRFQGAGSPPKLGGGSGGSAIVDRSCNPRKDFQTMEGPCACGAARGGAPGGSGAGGPPCMAGGGGGGHGGVCPIARDPYNSMPCEDPDDPCYCSGPKPAAKPQMACKNTDQYCLHVPKGVLQRLPYCKELSQDQKRRIRAAIDETENVEYERHRTRAHNNIVELKEHSQATIIVHEYLQTFIDNIKLPVKLYETDSYMTEFCSTTSLRTLRSKKRSVSFSDTVNCISRSLSQSSYCSIDSEENVKESLFGKKETTVYMTMYHDFMFPLRSSGTQATASINKCLQVTQDFYDTQYIAIRNGLKPEYYSTSTTSTLPQRYMNKSIYLQRPDIYFFGRNKEEPESGMGSSDSKSKLKETRHATVKSEPGESNTKGSSSTQAQSGSCSKLKGSTSTHSRPGSNSNIKGSYSTPAQSESRSKLKCNTSTHFRPGSNSNIKCSNSTQAQSGSRSKLKGSTSTHFRPGSNSNIKDSNSMQAQSGNRSKLKGSTSTHSRSGRNSNIKGSTQAQLRSSSTAAQTKNTQGSSDRTSTAKTVSIKDEKPCPAAGSAFAGEMVATVSHIRIGAREPCPVHGKAPCQGPKCIIASSADDQQAPVKVTTVTNPRRGVFELVVRRMTGAPLAKNELMLEWTPPPSRPPPCGSPCPMPCSPPGPCRPPKCKMIVCRPSPCRPKSCKKACKKPCAPMPCRSVPCKRKSCKSCCGRPCRPCPPLPRCKPYKSPPLRCAPCPPCKAPCGPPCCKSPCDPSCCKLACSPASGKNPCTIPCCSTPCLHPCPVGRRRPRKARSQPRMRSHKKRISPCYNRSKFCPAVQCRSCCGPPFPLPCPPRKCCSVYPCKPLKCCKSSCSSCRGACG